MKSLFYQKFCNSLPLPILRGCHLLRLMSITSCIINRMRTGNCSFRVALSSRSKYWSIRICNLSRKFFFLKNVNLISYTVTIHFCDRIIHRLNTNAKEFSFSLKLGHFLPLFFFAIRILKSAQSLFNLMKCTEISLKPSPKTQFFFRKKNQYAWRFRDYCKIIKSNSFIKRKCKVWSDKKKSVKLNYSHI